MVLPPSSSCTSADGCADTYVVMMVGTVYMMGGQERPQCITRSPARLDQRLFGGKVRLGADVVSFLPFSHTPFSIFHFITSYAHSIWFIVHSRLCMLEEVGFYTCTFISCITTSKNQIAHTRQSIRTLLVETLVRLAALASRSPRTPTWLHWPALTDAAKSAAKRL